MNAMVNVNIDLDALVAPTKGFSWTKAFQRFSPGEKDYSNEKTRDFSFESTRDFFML